MAEAPVPDRPNTQSNVCPWLKVPGHADVLIRTMEAGGLLRLLLLSLRPRGFLSSLRHHLIVFRCAAARRCICRQATHPMRHVRDPLAGRPIPRAR